MRVISYAIPVLASVVITGVAVGEPLCKTITRDVFASNVPMEMRELMLGAAAPGDYICTGAKGQCPAKLEIEVGTNASALQPMSKSTLCQNDKDRRVCALEPSQAIRLTTEKGTFSYIVSPDDHLKIATKSNGFYSCTPGKH